MIKFWDRILKVISKHAEASETGCEIWKGTTDKDGYPIMQVPWPGEKRKLERVQRMRLRILHAGKYSLPKVNKYGAPMEVSHICHNRSCIKLDHLVLETHQQNMCRRHCVAARRCLGGHGPACIIPELKNHGSSDCPFAGPNQ